MSTVRLQTATRSGCSVASSGLAEAETAFSSRALIDKMLE